MKTIEIWAPVFAAPSTSAETLLPVTNTNQANSNELVGLEPIDLEGCETDSIASAGIFTGINKAYSFIRPHQVNMDVLSNNLKEALANFQQLINDVPEPASGYFIDEIEINLGVNGNGGITLIGKMEVGLEAAITQQSEIKTTKTLIRQTYGMSFGWPFILASRPPICA